MRSMWHLPGSPPCAPGVGDITLEAGRVDAVLVRAQAIEVEGRHSAEGNLPAHSCRARRSLASWALRRGQPHRPHQADRGFLVQVPIGWLPAPDPFSRVGIELGEVVTTTLKL